MSLHLIKSRCLLNTHKQIRVLCHGNYLMKNQNPKLFCNRKIYLTSHLKETTTTEKQNIAAVKSRTLPISSNVRNVIDISNSASIGKETHCAPTTVPDPANVKWFHCPGIYANLSKWYLSWFVVITADAGYCLAPTQFDLPIFYAATFGTLLCAFSANSFNQIAEVKLDSLMDRTKKRPLVKGIITPLHAKMFALSSGLSGVACLYFGVNTLTAILGASNIALYALVYTPLKQKHWSNTWVGSIVGAIPPVMGWTAATGSLDAGAFIFAGILYAWQFPHFFALAWRRRADYARGSYKMLPLSHPYATRVCVLAHSLCLSGISLISPLTGVTTWSFILLSAPVNAWLLRDSWNFYRQGNSKTAQKLYKCSLYYIILISCVLVADRKVIPKIKKLNEPPKNKIEQHISRE